MNIEFTKIVENMPSALVVVLSPDAVSSPTLEGLDSANAAAVRATVTALMHGAAAGTARTAWLPGEDSLLPIMALALADTPVQGPVGLRLQAYALLQELRRQGLKDAYVLCESAPAAALSAQGLALALAEGIAMADYRFDQHRTVSRPAAASGTLSFCVTDPEHASALYAQRKSVVRAMHLARDLTNAPPNHLTPTDFARFCTSLGSSGLEVEVLHQPDLEALGMGALLGVAKGSVEPAAVAILSWRGADECPPTVLVGKGVTFDSGGLLPKGPEEMWDMKNDMAGAAAVVAIMQSAAERKLLCNVVGIVGLVENMPSGHALRPGDVVTTLSGQTVEVLHTDAEGRLVLADLLTYAQQRFHPAALVDIATLTGAMTAVLGQEYAGLFSNSDELAARVASAADVSGEKVWRLPLCEEFDRMLDSPVADIQNITRQKMAGSATAAQFLARFVHEVPWAHLDICGTAWRKDKDLFDITGATGAGVLLLDGLLQGELR